MHDEPPRVALVVGDTAGHTHPALAVADAIRACDARATILFFGTATSVGASIVGRTGQLFVPIPGSPIRNADFAGLARAGLTTSQSFVTARRALVDRRVQLVMGFGGFASGGVILAARTLGLTTAILEANVEFGLANRWLRPWVDRVFLGLGPPETSVTGVPVRMSVMTVRRDIRLAAGPLRILVASGSRGTEFFATHLPSVIKRLVARGVAVQIRQQTDAFIDDIAGAYDWADIALARGGASTIAELAVTGLPALIVPLAEASADHQAANAALWQRAGAGPAILERDWREDAVVDWLQVMATDAESRRAASCAARRLARPDAAAEIAGECLRLITRPS